MAGYTNHLGHALAVVLMVVLLAGCGGSVSTTTSVSASSATFSTTTTPAPQTSSVPTTTGSAATRPAGQLVGTLPISPNDTPLFVPWKGSLFVLVTSSATAGSFAVLRVDQGGNVTRGEVAFPLASSLMNLSAGPDGIYAGTAVTKRFTNQPDELLRIDPNTLKVAASASFPASVTPLAVGADLWVSLGDGRVLKLDPDNLAVFSSQRVLAAAVASTGGVVSAPAFGLGSLWVLAGDESDLELVRLDPKSLAIRSETKVPTTGPLYQALDRVVADTSHVYLTGSAIVAVDRTGKLGGAPVVVPGLESANICGEDLVGVADQNGQTSLLELDAGGNVLARTTLLDGGGQIEVSGNDIWFDGNAGQGNGIIHMRLTSS